MAAKPAKKRDPLDALAEGDLRRVIAILLWKDRKRNPDLYAKIDEKDLQGFDDCVDYLKVTPEVRIERPKGLPAQAAIPAAGNRRAVPGREATPDKPYVIVSLLGKDKAGITGPIKPVENNEDDYDVQQQLERVRKARDQAPQLAARILSGANKGEFSLSDIQDAAQALVLLAGAA